MHSTLRTRAARVGLLALLSAAALPLSGQGVDVVSRGTQDGQWPTYGGDLASRRYSPLSQVDATNFGKLEIAWRFKTENLGPRPEFQFQATPLMVNGTLYFTAGSRRAAVAVDAATGEMKWMHSLNEGDRGSSAPRQLSGRGLSYWSDGKEERILYVTPGYQMVALDAKTGSRIPGFGKDGIVDLKLEMDQQMDLVKGEVGLHAAPIVSGNTIVIGAAHMEGGAPKSKTRAAISHALHDVDRTVRRDGPPQETARGAIHLGHDVDDVFFASMKVNNSSISAVAVVWGCGAAGRLSACCRPCSSSHVVDLEKSSDAPQVCTFKIEMNGPIVHLVGVATTVRLWCEGAATVSAKHALAATAVVSSLDEDRTVAIRACIHIHIITHCRSIRHSRATARSCQAARSLLQ